MQAPRIALIACPYPLEEYPSPPLGLCYAAAAFEAAGARVEIFDYIVRAQRDEKMIAELDRFNPHAVGINAVTMNVNTALEIIRFAKRHRPETITIMGGPHVTFAYENILATVPEVDLIVVGEAEATIAALTPVLHDRSAWHKIPGLAFREKGQPLFTGPRDPITDLDALPLPAWHLLPMSRYLALGFPISIITSRGCPHRCIFCQGRHMVGRRVRNRSAKAVVDEIEAVLALGFERINIADDCFTSSKRRVLAVCAEIEGRGLRFGWTAFARVDCCDPEVIKVMLAAGCDTVSFGIESANPDILKRVKKGINLDQVRQAVAVCKQAGMGVLLSFIAGLPGETELTLRETADFAESLKVPFAYHYLAPFPGTPLWEQIEQYDLEIISDNWDDFNANRPVTQTPHLSARAVSAFVGEYESEIQKAWQTQVRRYRAGQASAKEAFAVEARERMQFIFKLLSEDLVEKWGRFDNGHCQANALEAFSKRLCARLDDRPLIVRRSLSDLTGRGYLQCRFMSDGCQWYWT